MDRSANFYRAVMTFISYAQNYEDVMLWRALKHVEKGFYIDVGANDPTVDSVTYAFYKQGWHGINIEPLHTHFEDLCRERPHDINLLCAVGSSSGEAEIWECDVRGWATLSKKIVEQHIAEGHTGAFHKVPMFTLTDICTKYATGEIHFLKIDVEGLEKSVIEGMNFTIFRPWIVVVEAIRPNTTIEVYQEWEYLLLNADYHLVYKDGINRFYLSQEHEGLLTNFQYPPNMLDNFIRADHLESELRSQQADGFFNQLAITQATLTVRDTALAEQQAHSQWLQNEWDTAKARLEHLAGELALSQARADDFESQLAITQATLTVRDTALAEQQAHSQWLQNEWDTAKAKINELNSISHHWWSVADQGNYELQTIYKSKFWRITWPLRILMQFIKWLVFPPFRLLRWIIRLPRRAARWLLTRAMAFAMKHPSLSMRVRHWLGKYPKLKYHLRLFAQMRGLINVPSATMGITETCLFEQSVTPPDSFLVRDPDLITPRARRIFNELKVSIEKKQDGK
jgi:FkbM family methyltransferase